VQPLWQRIFCRSPLEFASPVLEAGYQAYLANHPGGYLLAFAPMFALGWVQTFHCVIAGGTATGSNPPPGFVASVLLFLLPVTALVAFVLLQPKVYSKHWRGINAAFMLVHVFSTPGFQSLCLWQQACISSGVCGFGGGGSPSWFHAFAIDNFFLTVICLRLIMFSAGPAPDLFFTTLGLLASMRGNGALCASPLWGPERVTLSPRLRAIPQKGSSLLLSLLSPDARLMQILPKELSCPAVLAFWQVLGWWLACIVIILRDILSRRAFLTSAGSRYGPSVAQRAGGWPFGSNVLINRLICAVLFACIAASFLWAVALQLLQ
jgi:hypothetical protein